MKKKICILSKELDAIAHDIAHYVGALEKIRVGLLVSDTPLNITITTAFEDDRWEMQDVDVDCAAEIINIEELQETITDAVRFLLSKLNDGSIKHIVAR